jgi:hypothetical protein
MNGTFDQLYVAIGITLIKELRNYTPELFWFENLENVFNADLVAKVWL